MGSIFAGIAGVIISALFWGSNFVVTKGYDLPSDGIHFVFLMAIGILLVGIITLFFAQREDGDFEVVFSPLGLLGGCIWCFGNFLTVPIVKSIGLGIGLAIWAGVNLIVAFIVGAVGMHDILPKEELADPTLGVIGIGFAVGALILFSQVKPTLDTANRSDGRQELVPLLDNEVGFAGGETNAVEERYCNSGSNNNSNELSPEVDRPDHTDDNVGMGQSDSVVINNEPKTFLRGILLATIAGTCYGFMFVPLSIWNDKINKSGHIFDHEKPSETVQALRFFFSQFAGIFLTATAGFTIYCILKHNEPLLVPPEATFPSICSGILWAVGCAGGMLATSAFGNAVGFPLILNFAFLVNSSWSIIYFKEIRDRRSLVCFGLAFVLNVASSILISLSKAS